MTNPTLTPLLPVLRKLAKIAETATAKADLTNDCFWELADQEITLGDCRKIKRWLAKHDAQKKLSANKTP